MKDRGGGGGSKAGAIAQPKHDDLVTGGHRRKVLEVVENLHAVEPSVEGPRRPRILGVVFSAVASMLRRVEALRGVASPEL